MPNRIFSDWIEACANVAQGSITPPIFRKWAALSAVAGALGRRCWYDAGEYKVRPNLYITLVAPPGHGKSVGLILPFDKVFRKLTEPLVGNRAEVEGSRLIWERYVPNPPGTPLRLVSGRVTPERLAQLMKKAEHCVLDAPGELTSAAITIKTNEFGQFMTQTNQFLQITMTEGWDAVETFEYQTKNMGDDIIHGMCLNWAAAATPSEFVANMPANATEQGLLSRILPINYTGSKPPSQTRGLGYSDEDVERLAEDLGQISALVGPFDWAPGVEENLVQPWLDAGCPPTPTDPMMKEYNARRFSHLIKICMGISAARRSDRLITADDWNSACEMLFEAETFMPALLRRFGMTDAGKFADDLLDFGRTNANKDGYIKASLIKREAIRLARNLSEIDTAIQMLTASKQLVQEGDLYKVLI